MEPDGSGRRRYAPCRAGLAEIRWWRTAMATKDTPEISDIVTTDQTGATVAPPSPAQLFPGAAPQANPAAPAAGNDAFQPTPGNDPDIPNESNLQRMGVG